METTRPPTTAPRRRRLAEELVEEGLGFVLLVEGDDPLLDELDYALRPPVHEQRVPSFGVMIEPTVPAESWSASTELSVSLRHTAGYGDDQVRRFADGAASWAVRLPSGIDEFVVFDRPAGAERDLVVLAQATGARIVQRGDDGVVRIVGDFGVVRSTVSGWHHEPPLSSWIHDVPVCAPEGRQTVLGHLLDFAVHDLGARHIGSLLVLHRTGDLPGAHEHRLPRPPELHIERPYDLAPLRHGLSQSDGASVFDASGMLRWMGVHLTPSRESEEAVGPLGGTKHTSALRYSWDDPEAIVIVVSDDGPVTVMTGGQVVGRSPEDGTVTAVPD
ncbi:MAG TPA: diadenylate cyclase [Acidimicrobiales bacterium]|nr:diadenylate cyclase [Acidimicrobiales bacterium]